MFKYLSRSHLFPQFIKHLDLERYAIQDHQLWSLLCIKYSID